MTCVLNLHQNHTFFYKGNIFSKCVSMENKFNNQSCFTGSLHGHMG